MNKYIITGSCCSGKTTIIKLLEKHTYNIIPEVARTIISQEQKKDDGVFPCNSKDDLLKFQYLVLEEQEKRENQINQLQSDTVFLDRGAIDGIGYLYNNEIDIPENLRTRIEQCQYEKAFFLELLEKKYFLSDKERVESYPEALKLEKSIHRAYEDLGLETIIIPNKLSIQDRLDMILSNIS